MAPRDHDLGRPRTTEKLRKKPGVTTDASRRGAHERGAS
jgi:hypothetical protein